MYYELKFIIIHPCAMQLKTINPFEMDGTSNLCYLFIVNNLYTDK